MARADDGGGGDSTAADRREAARRRRLIELNGPDDNTSQGSAGDSSADRREAARRRRLIELNGPDDNTSQGSAGDSSSSAGSSGGSSSSVATKRNQLSDPTRMGVCDSVQVTGADYGSPGVDLDLRVQNLGSGNVRVTFGHTDGKTLKVVNFDLNTDKGRQAYEAFRRNPWKGIPTSPEIGVGDPPKPQPKIGVGADPAIQARIAADRQKAEAAKRRLAALRERRLEKENQDEAPISDNEASAGEARVRAAAAERQAELRQRRLDRATSDTVDGAGNNVAPPPSAGPVTQNSLAAEDRNAF